MESIIRNVKDIEIADRLSLEHVVGRQLRDDQQIIIQVVTVSSRGAEGKSADANLASAADLPAYCNVYDGLSDEEVAELESLILDRSPSRTS